MPLTQGQTLNNRYRIARLLGQGGFGAVYRAWDLNFEVVCAIKENIESTPEAQRQFLREARLLHVLRHPNLPQVKDYFVIAGQGQYLVMDYVEGQDLEEMRLQAGGTLPETQALGWIAQVCDALDYLHRQTPPVIHRDIKPANIKITPEGQAMLVDFGIAKTYDPALKTTLGAQAVTPGYSPFEQYGRGFTDARTDLYALGATLYTLLTGQEPPEAPKRALRDPLVPPRQLNPAISPAVEAALLHALQVDPDHRYQGAAEFKRALTASSGAVSVVTQPPATFPARRAGVSPTAQAGSASGVSPTRRFPWKWVGMAMGLLAALALLIVMVRLIPDGGGDSALTETSQAGDTQTAQALTTIQATARTPQPATPVSTPGPTQTSPVDGMLQVYIPGGSFQMGEDAERALEQCQLLSEPFKPTDCTLSLFSGEQPVHNVVLDSFWMDQSEVTNAQYAQCIAAGACTLPGSTASYSSPVYYRQADFADYPVISVSWDQAAAYCAWAGRELPSEAQWEYAARGGLTRQLYPWGDTFDGTLANFCDASCPLEHANPDFNDGHADTAPVGSYPANGYGLYDLAGNVWEWVADWHASYPYTAVENPGGPASGDMRVLRGGSWDNTGAFLRVAYRGSSDPGFNSYNLGFRCAAAADAARPTATPAPTSTLAPPLLPTITLVRPASYVLQPGEFPFCLAKRFDVNPYDLLALNGISESSVINPGTTLRIPQSGSHPGDRSYIDHPTTYTVRTGDTIYSIACAFGDVYPEAIAYYNRLQPPYTLVAGQTLWIP